MATQTGTIPEKLQRYMESDNIAPALSTERVLQIGGDVVKDTNDDKATRYKWEKKYKEALKIAKQVIEAKNTPWPNAANVKYPLITEACIQYNARTNPEIVQGDKVVHVDVMGKDPTGDLEERADRLSEYMSYQLLEESENWRSDTDKLLMTLPLVGTVFRKTYFDPIDRKPVIDFCLPDDIVVHNKIASLEKAPRITHILHLNTNDIWERMRAGIYTEYPLEDLLVDNKEEENSISPESSTEAADEVQMKGVHVVYEQHTFLDLDNDGYKEPYIITVHRDSQKVLRIVARYDEDSFKFSQKSGRFIKIKAIQYFTDYHFLPSPDGSFLSLGFGTLLYPLNATINTILNQLLDAGTLSNRGGGFIARAARLRKQELRFKLGEFKEVNVPAGTTLAQSIYPMPSKEPSPALFNLLGLLVKSAQELSSVSDVLQGQSPGANTPVGTTMAMVEQGLKVYSSMLTRLYQAFKKEFQKLYDLNRKYFEEYEDSMLAVKSGDVTVDDFTAPDYAVLPVADPQMGSDMQRLLQAQFLMGMLEIPGINKYEILHRVLAAHKVTNIDKILPPPPPPNAPPPPPSPQEQLMLAQAQAELKKTEGDAHYAQMKPHLKFMDKELTAIGLQIEEKKAQAQAAYWGIVGTSSKINSITEMAEADHTMGIDAMQVAQQQEQQIETPVADAGPDVQMRLQGVEDMLQNLMGMLPPGAQGTPSQQQPPAPEPPEGPQPGAEEGVPTPTPISPQGAEVPAQEPPLPQEQ